MTEYITTLIGAIATVNILIWGKPFILIKELLLKPLKWHKTDTAHQTISNHINCAICSGFWIGGLIGFFYLNLEILPLIFFASMVAIGSELINKKLLPSIF